MFDDLTQKLDVIFKKIRGQGRLTEANIKDAMRDIRRTFLEADVNYRVVRRFMNDVQEKVLGAEVIASITPGQMIVKIVYDELISILGGNVADFQFKGSPEIIMVCGLNGSGKTTSVAKLALYLRKHSREAIVSSVDVHRPAAVEQLRVIAEKHNIQFYGSLTEKNPLLIAEGALAAVRHHGADTLIMDTAGRLHINEEMMKELSRVAEVLKPHHVLFVADGMTGQDAVNAVEGFTRYVEFDGVILTKMDGDARGGAALSIREVTGKPILFIGTGERIEAFERFHPDRCASRILGMGDIISLVEKAQEVVDERDAQKLQKKMFTEGLTLEDFLNQLHHIKKMGPLDQLLGMIPGVGKAMKGMNFNNSELKHIEAIILSMTHRERKNPSIIDGSRRRRIGQGSGTSIQDINNLLKQFHTMQKMMKKMSKMKGKMESFPDFNFPF